MKKLTNFRPCLRTEKFVEHEGQGNTRCSWCPRNDTKETVVGTEATDNQWENENHSD